MQIKRNALLKKVIFSLIATAILLVAIVAWDILLGSVARIPNPYHAYDNLQCYLSEGHLAYFHHPFFWELIPSNRSVSLKGVVYNTNSLGFRGQEIANPAAANTQLVVMMGDSSIFGFNVEESGNLPQQIEAYLREHSAAGTVEVLNAGVPGYTSTQGLIQLRTRILRFKPQLILLSYGWNEKYSKAQSLEALDGLVTRAFPLYRTWRWLHDRSWITRQLSSWWLRPAADSALGNSELLRSAGSVAGREAAVRAEQLAAYRRNLVQMVSFCRKNGIQVAFAPVTVPPPFLAAMRSVARAVDAPMFETERALHHAWRRARRYDAGDSGDPRLQYSAIRRDRSLFVDSCHPSIRGFRIITDEIGPKVAQLLEQQRHSNAE